MRKIIFSVCLILITCTSIFAQQKDFEWRLGFSMGYSNYYGDLSPYQVRGLSNMEAIHHLFYFNSTYFERPSFKATLERQLSPTVGLMFSYAEYHFAMSDRYVQRDGRLMLENPNFFRSLNFRNHTRDMGLSFVFKTDNDRLLSSKSLIAPYFTLGFGLINFEVYGDLLDDDGNRYDYTIPEPVNNFEYETDLQPLRTEVEGGYSLGSLYTNLGLGFRIRLGNRMELFAQSDFLYTFTDYLDDVSGQYRDSYDNDFQAYAANPSGMTLDPSNPDRGNPNSPNDWIIFHSVGLKFNFGASKKTFRAPRISSFRPSYTSSTETPKIEIPTIEEPLEIEEEIEETKAATNNFYNIQMVDGKRLDSLEYKSQTLLWQQQILEREKLLLQGQKKQDEFTTLRSQFSSNLEDLQKEENLDPEEKEQMLEDSRERISDLRYSIDSTRRRESEIKTEIDSLRNLLQGRREVGSALTPTPDNVDEYVQERVHANIDSMRSQIHEEKIRRQPNIDTAQTLKRPDTIPEVEELETVQDEAPQREEEARVEGTDRTTTTIGYDDDPRIRRLQEEADYLRYQRDMLLLDQRDRERGTTQPQERVITERVIERPEDVRTSEPEEETRRRRRWWPFAAGAATGAVASSERVAPSEQPAARATPSETPPDEMPTLSPTELNRIGLAISGAIIGTSFLTQSAGSDDREQEMAPTPPEREKEDNIFASTAEIIRDTIYVENEPVVRMLKSKEIIYFEVNQRQPEEEELRKLADMADFVKDNPTAKLVLTGFADNTGNVNYNLRLAEDRTNAVAEALTESFGLSPDQIEVESGGQVVRGTQRVANERDRRVEVKIVMEN